MLKKEELTNPGSCLNKAADDEPLFVLRANDELAPDAVDWWAAHYRDSKGGPDYMTKEQRFKYAQAVVEAERMRAWKKQHS